MLESSTPHRQSDPDSSIIASLLHAGNPDAFQYFIDSGHVAKLTKRLKHANYTHWKGQLSDADIEDIVFETQLQVFDEKDRYDPTRSSIETWLTRKANYIAQDLLRSHKLPNPIEEQEKLSEYDKSAAHSSELPSPLIRQRPTTRGEVLNLLKQSRSASTGTISNQLS